MADQSGPFPETLREAPWASLNDVVTAYVSDVAPPGGDSPRAIVLAAIDRLRAALERPRPAPPDSDELQRLNAETNHTLTTPYAFQDTPAGKYARGILIRWREIVLGGGTAGTGAHLMPRVMALVGGVLMLCDELERSTPGFPTIDGKRLRVMAEEVRDAWPAGTGAAPPDLRDRVRDDWTAGYKAGQESGVPPSPEGANERFERIAAEFYEDTGYLRPGKDVPAAVGGESYDRERNAAWKIWNAARVRGGAAQPPPSAPIRELAEAAQGYLNSQEMVGSTEEMRRALRQRLGQLIGPHLVAQCAGVPREETNHE